MFLQHQDIPKTSGKIAWYENIDSNGIFSEQQIISEINKPSVGQYVYAADIDGDNDMDILNVFGYAPLDRTGKVSWYKNLANEANLSIINNNLIISSSSIYPNPTKGILNIDANTTPKQVDVFNILGKKVLSFHNTNEIDITNLNNGLYLMLITNKNKQLTLKIIKE